MPNRRPRDTGWLSTKAASEHLGISARLLYRLIDSGQIPAYRMGRVIRLRQYEVDEFIERSRIAPGELEHLYFPGDHPLEGDESSHEDWSDWEAALERVRSSVAYVAAIEALLQEIERRAAEEVR